MPNTNRREGRAGGFLITREQAVSLVLLLHHQEEEPEPEGGGMDPPFQVLLRREPDTGSLLISRGDDGEPDKIDWVLNDRGEIALGETEQLPDRAAVEHALGIDVYHVDKLGNGGPDLKSAPDFVPEDLLESDD